MSEYIIEMTEDNYQELLQQSAEIPTIFYFTAGNNPKLSEYNELLIDITNNHKGFLRLVTLDCEKYQYIAAQFGIQNIPMLYLFKDGSPINALSGILTKEELLEQLAIILPKEYEILYQEALTHLQHEDYNGALNAIKGAWELTNKKNSDYALLYAETYIAVKKIDSAQEILQQIPLQDRDSRWHGLQAQIELLKKAADTPEIAELQLKYQSNHDNQTAIDLAIQLQQAHRNEEALKILFAIVKKDLNAEEGKVKEALLAIITALGTGDSLGNQYRRLLYSLLY